jgi:hypothetical protein
MLPMKSQNIRSAVEHIRDCVHQNRRDDIANHPHVESLKKLSPELYDKLCARICDMNMIGFFLNKLSSIEGNQISPYDADRDVGQVMYERYVAPLVDAEKEGA